VDWDLGARALKKTLAFLTAGTLGAGIISAVATWQRTFEPSARTPAANHKTVAQTQAPIFQVIEAKRRVYPYSIVPGGAWNLQEAKRSMTDPAVREHYAAFNLKNLKQVELKADLYGYVSYRFGEKIYWTSNKLHLKAGETVYTDGQHIARGRCLNCYSAHPMMPIRPHEPAEAVLDMSVEVPVIAFAVPNPPLEPAPALPPPPAPAARTVGGAGAAPSHGGWGFIPIIPIIPYFGHSNHPAPPPPVIPPTVVPEPRYGWLVPGIMMMLVIVGRSWKRGRSADSLRGFSFPMAGTSSAPNPGRGRTCSSSTSKSPS
jgi:hypothetical protein